MSRDSKATYYDAGGIEVLDVIEAKLPAEWLKGYLLGNCMKYALRLAHKGCPVADARKLANYSKWLSEILEQGENKKESNNA